jgi:hypothetical protein
MIRHCSGCGKAYTPAELSREESKGMEAERKALGLGGVLFRYYHCSACGHDDIFLDIHPLPGESDADFQRRRGELEATVRQIHAEGVGISLVERRSGQG